MEKCWFVLRQTSFPPPTFPTSPSQQSTGPLCLGHLIPSPLNLTILNPNPLGPDPYPPNMPIWSSSKQSFTFSHSAGSDFSLSARTTGVVKGVGGKVEEGWVFRRTVRNWGEFGGLDTYHFQPTRSYVEDGLEEQGVKNWIEGEGKGVLGGWSVCMISGVVIARGVKMGGIDDGRERGIVAGAGVQVQGQGQASVSSNAKSEGRLEGGWQGASDFVWAVKVVRIRKGVRDKRWEMRDVNKGATYSFGDEEDSGEGRKSIEAALSEDGIDVGGGEFNVYTEGEDEVYIVRGNLDNV